MRGLVVEPTGVNLRFWITSVCGVTSSCPLPALPECTVVAEKVAVIVWMLACVGVTVTWQVAWSLLRAARVQVPVIVSPESELTDTTVPTPGLDFGPLESVSVTVTVAVVPSVSRIGLALNDTTVVVARLLTVRPALPPLPEWTIVAAKVAENVWTLACVGVTVTEQVALSVLLAASVHVPVIVSPESELRATMVPTPGLDLVPLESVSVTVTVAVVD